MVTTSGARPAATIQVPRAEATPHGTEFLVRVDPADGESEFLLFDGEMTVSSPREKQVIPAGHAGRVELDGSIGIRPLLQVTNVTQWWIDYPFVLELADLGFAPADEVDLAASIAAYRQGNLIAALRAYPGYPNPIPSERDAPRLYLAALLLSTGAVAPAQNLIAEAADPRHPAARALRTPDQRTGSARARLGQQAIRGPRGFRTVEDSVRMAGAQLRIPGPAPTRRRTGCRPAHHEPRSGFWTGLGACGRT